MSRVERFAVPPDLRSVKRARAAPGMLVLAVDQSVHVVVLIGLAPAAGG